MFWKPKRFVCDIYENKRPLLLSQCTYSEILSLMNAIEELWKQSPQQNQNIWYTVDLEEKRYFFRRRTPTIKISCFTLQPHSWSGKKQISIDTLQHGQPIGKPVKITPKNTLAHTWSRNMEVVFLKD